MYWTLELASKLEDAPWPATKDELIDYATRSGAWAEKHAIMKHADYIFTNNSNTILHWCILSVG